MEFLDLPPLHQAQGTIRLPGSKSISNRTLLLAALSEGVTEIRDLLASDDTQMMLQALRQLGVPIEKTGDYDYQVTGVPHGFPNKGAAVYLSLGNAGTAFRPLTAALALSGGEYLLSGVARMQERPIGDLVDALRQLGANIQYEKREGFPPLYIRPAMIHSPENNKVFVRGNVSSQFLTALLMALPLMKERMGAGISIEVTGELISKPYIEITINLMRHFGVKVNHSGGWSRLTIAGGQKYRSPGTVYVEGDASSASYFLAAGAIAGGPVRVEGVGRNSIQGDVAFAETLQQLGARIRMGDNWIEAAAPTHGKLRAFDMDFNHIPDAAMTLAVAALFCDGPSRLTNIGSWRVKETDRIAAMATELRKVGAVVEEGSDWLRITPPAQLTASAVIDTYDDHRMAMCFSLVALGGVPIRINDPKCVAKTFPEYFDKFHGIAR